MRVPRTGCWGIAEGAALPPGPAAAGGHQVARRDAPARARADRYRRHRPARGRLAIVGIRPGRRLACPGQRPVIRASDVVGYRLYLDLLGPAVSGKTCTRHARRRDRRARLARPRRRRQRRRAGVNQAMPAFTGCGAGLRAGRPRTAARLGRRRGRRVARGESHASRRCRVGAPLGHVSARSRSPT